MLTLKNWYLQRSWIGELIANGKVYGHYRLEDGDFIHTSDVKRVYAWEKNGYIFETFSGSLYQVYESEMYVDGIQETKKLIDEIGVIEDNSINERLSKANEDFSHKKQLRDAVLDNAEYYLEKHASNGEMYLVMEGMKAIKALYRYENSIYELTPQVHEGMVQDSILITDWKHGYVDFRYFPSVRMKPYHWSDGLEKLHIHNIGTYDFFFKGTREDILCKVDEVVVISKDKYLNEYNS